MRFAVSADELIRQSANCSTAYKSIVVKLNRSSGKYVLKP